MPLLSQSVGFLMITLTGHSLFKSSLATTAQHALSHQLLSTYAFFKYYTKTAPPSIINDCPVV